MGKKSNYKILRRAANKLPQYLQPTKIIISGKDILEKNANAKMIDGTPVYSDKFYKADSFVPKNHFRALKKAFKKGGHKMAIEYFNDIISAGNNAVNGSEEIEKGITERSSIIPFGL